MDYHIVIQNGIRSDCLFGIRYHVTYISKDSFLGTPKLDESIALCLAEGITNQEAEDLVALTPEICLYMETIEEHFSQNQFPNTFLLQKALENTRATVVERNRTSLLSSKLKRINAKPFVEHFEKIARENSQSIKSFATMWVLSTIVNQHTGQVR